jgi:hypothetical protein
MSWLGAFLFTQVVEIPIYLWGLYRARLELGWAARLAVAFGASALTHPIVWFVFPRLWRTLEQPGGYWGMVAAAEAFAVIAEAIYLVGARVKPGQAFLWALFANGASVCLGFWSRFQFGWP